MTIMTSQLDLSIFLSDMGKPIKLGCGQFGEVYKVRKGETIYALKKFRDFDKKILSSEIEVLKECQHINIIGFKGSFEKENELFILMEYADVGSLTRHLQRLSNDTEWREGLGAEFNVWRFITHLSSAFQYLHEKRIMHRDVKPDNVLGVSNRDGITWKLGDFGLANFFQNNYPETVCGTIIYMAPEVLLGNNYSFPADIWAFGCLLWFFCNKGQHLLQFPAINWKGLVKPIPGFYSAALRDLIAKMLLPEPDERLSPAVILQECMREERQERPYCHGGFLGELGVTRLNNRKQNEMTIILQGIDVCSEIKDEAVRNGMSDPLTAKDVDKLCSLSNDAKSQDRLTVMERTLATICIRLDQLELKTKEKKRPDDKSRRELSLALDDHLCRKCYVRRGRSNCCADKSSGYDSRKSGGSGSNGESRHGRSSCRDERTCRDLPRYDSKHRRRDTSHCRDASGHRSDESDHRGDDDRRRRRRRSNDRQRRRNRDDRSRNRETESSTDESEEEDIEIFRQMRKKERVKKRSMFSK